MSRPALPLPVVLETVLTDANVLFSRVLRDYILYAAEEGLIAVAWSQQVLDDMAEHMMEKIHGFRLARASQVGPRVQM